VTPAAVPGGFGYRGWAPAATPLLTALLAGLLPLIEGQSRGWPPWTYGCFAAAVPLLAGLWRWGAGPSGPGAPR
jgi:hypothetical protein